MDVGGEASHLASSHAIRRSSPVRHGSCNRIEMGIITLFLRITGVYDRFVDFGVQLYYAKPVIDSPSKRLQEMQTDCLNLPAPTARRLLPKTAGPFVTLSFLP
jgi:hypothetical protein